MMDVIEEGRRQREYKEGCLKERREKVNEEGEMRKSSSSPPTQNAIAFFQHHHRSTNIHTEIIIEGNSTSSST